MQGVAGIGRSGHYDDVVGISYCSGIWRVDSLQRGGQQQRESETAERVTLRDARVSNQVPATTFPCGEEGVGRVTKPSVLGSLQGGMGTREAVKCGLAAGLVKGIADVSAEVKLVGWTLSLDIAQCSGYVATTVGTHCCILVRSGCLFELRGEAGDADAGIYFAKCSGDGDGA